MLQELLTHLKERDERDVAEVSEPVEQREEEVIDSIPCRGGEDNLTNVDVTGEDSTVADIEMPVPEGLRMFSAEERAFLLQAHSQEVEDFRALFDKEGLAKLERRTKRE